jgi:DNA-binding response OmpR family regulator
MSDKLLIVDDSPIALNVASETLKGVAEVLVASTGQEALEIAERELPDVILLDVTLPDMDGFLILERLKQNERLADIYVIFLSGTLLDAEAKVRGLNLGAYDYLLKPVDPRELVARVRVGFRMKQAERVFMEGVQLAFRTFRHELNNPLQALMMNLELLERPSTQLDERVKLRLSRIRESAERIHSVLKGAEELRQIQTTHTSDGDVLLLASKT